MRKIIISVILISSLFSFTKKEKTWVAIGDSITYLNDHQNETGNRITKGYMSLICEQFPNIKYINQGHNGWTAKRIAKEIENLNIQRADIYTVFLGTNDWWQGLPIGTYSEIENGPDTFYGSIGLILSKIKKLNPKAKVVLITALQRGDFVYINNSKNNAFGSYKAKNKQYLSQFADALIEIAEYKKLKIVDLYHKGGIDMDNIVKFKRLKNPNSDQYQNYPFPEYLGIPFNPNDTEYPYPLEASNMTYDGLHPSDKGYEVIAKMILKEF